MGADPAPGATVRCSVLFRGVRVPPQAADPPGSAAASRWRPWALAAVTPATAPGIVGRGGHHRRVVAGCSPTGGQPFPLRLPRSGPPSPLPASTSMNRARSDRRDRPSRSRPALIRHRGRGLLHPLEDLLALAQKPPSAQESGSAQRRQRQRLALAQRLLDPLPPGLSSPEATADQFWRVLRWGGLGLIVARLLQR